MGRAAPSSQLSGTMTGWRVPRSAWPASRPVDAQKRRPPSQQPSWGCGAGAEVGRGLPCQHEGRARVVSGAAWPAAHGAPATASPVGFVCQVGAHTRPIGLETSAGDDRERGGERSSEMPPGGVRRRDAACCTHRDGGGSQPQQPGLHIAVGEAHSRADSPSLPLPLPQLPVPALRRLCACAAASLALAPACSCRSELIRGSGCGRAHVQSVMQGSIAASRQAGVGRGALGGASATLDDVVVERA